MLLATAQPVAREVDAVAGIGDDLADDPRLAAVLLENRQYEARFCGIDDDAEPDPHIVDLEHLGGTDRAVLLDELEYLWNGGQLVEAEADPRMVDPAEVQQAVAGDVNQRLDVGDAGDDLDDFAYVDCRRRSSSSPSATPLLGNG